MKNLLLVLLLTVPGLRAYAQVPPPAANGSNAPSYDEVMRRALRETGEDGTNLVTEPAPTKVETPPSRTLPTAINRPNPRPRPSLAQAVPSPGAAAPATTNPASVQPAAPAALPIPTPGAVPDVPAASTPATAPATGSVGGLALTPRVSTADNIAHPDEIVPAGSINFSAASLENVLQIYGEFVGRNVLRPSTLPEAKIVLKQTTPLTKLEVVRAIEAAMALNNVSVVNVGEKFVTVVPTADAWKIPGRINTNEVSQLAEMGSVATHIVQLKYGKPSELVQVLTPFASGTAANPIMPIDSSGILVLRDNVANVKRMLEMIERVDVAAQSEFISEVIPIKYAKAEEIASALSSVGGGSGGTVGSRPTGGTAGSGFTRPGGTGYGQPGGMPGGIGTTPTPTPSTGSSFSQNLQNIIRKAASSGDLQILGTTKIIADIRSNSLLVFATREDMKMIKDIVEKLDVVLAQVVIETIIMDVSLNSDWALGISAAQTPNQFTSSFGGAGGMNLKRFTDIAAGGGSTAGGVTNQFTDLIGTGLRYFGKVNDDIYVQVEAAANDGKVNVIQKPRIQTSHATPASLFIGNTVPYITGTYYGGGYNGGPSSTYQQLKVGIGLNVTPFINQDGLVVMKIDETIDELGTPVTIDGNAVPTTTSRQLSAEIAVRDKESIMLGGFIRNSDSKTKAGVPILKDIPLLGALFRSTGDSKQRTELMVLMRPTVLRTPELAAMQVAVEKQGLPGVVAAEEQLNQSERDAAERLQQEKLRDAEKKRGKKQQEPQFSPIEVETSSPTPPTQ